ncbi:NAD(P)/FAD-dependent oxidoreductase [Patescibacteria group bacterium]|nr:NAD(P)/FAD-dependent oxidoreductase [Patescibacteria group bacterium]
MIEKFDVAVIGGGPAGLMAAGRASELGARVVLLEKNSNLGIKLLMTGGGRCNFTNNSDIRNFINILGPNGRWFISALNIFSPEDAIDFFNSRGIETKIEDNNRVFPKSNKARDILDALIAYAQEGGVKILTNSRVEKIIKKDDFISKIVLSDGREVLAGKFILACGGKSYPNSGSSGEVYDWLKDLGHEINEVRPALCQLLINEDLSNLEGLSFSNVQIIAKNDNFKSSKLKGDVIFTRKGISGPVALNLSRELTRQNNNLDLFLDFFPDKNKEELKIEIINILNNNKNFSIKNSLGLLLTKRLSSFFLDKIGLNLDKKSSSLNKHEIESLVNVLKSNKLSFIGLGGFDEAMISSGGVSLQEIDNKTMASKIISNLYLVGETLNLDGPTGGYNLQIVWTSAYLAGSSCF